jgi:hypothetical protein
MADLGREQRNTNSSARLHNLTQGLTGDRLVLRAFLRYAVLICWRCFSEALVTLISSACETDHDVLRHLRYCSLQVSLPTKCTSFDLVREDEHRGFKERKKRVFKKEKRVLVCQL